MMWRKFTFSFTPANRRESRHFGFEKTFTDSLANAEEPDYIFLLEGVNDRATQRTYYLHCAPWEQCFARLLKEFSHEEVADVPIGETRRVHPTVPAVTEEIKSSTEEVASKLNGAHDKVRVWPTKGIDVLPGQNGGTLGDHDIAGEWQIECGDISFPLRLTIGQMNDLKLGQSEGVKATIRNEIIRQRGTVV